MSAAEVYLEKIRNLLSRLEETQMDAIARAGALCAETLLNDRKIYVNSQGSHSIHTEITERAGGFVGVAILSKDIAELRAGDIVISATNAGFDSSTVGLVLNCRARGVKTIAITSVAFERAIDSRDPSGKMLYEAADICIDLGGVSGDAVIELPGLDEPIIPSSGAISTVAVWMILAAAAERMIAAGKPPLIYRAIQLKGAGEHNARAKTAATQTGRAYHHTDDTLHSGANKIK